MATAEQYAQWIVDNQDKKGTPEFETVAEAYKLSKSSANAKSSDAPVSAQLGQTENDKKTIGAAFGGALGQGVGNVALGAQNLLGMGLEKLGAEQAGKWLQQDAAQGKAKLQREIQPYESQYPLTVAGGRLGGEVIGTLPVGGVLGKGLSAIPAVAKYAPSAIEAVRTGGMSAGGLTGAKALATRMAGGALTGGAAGALINPDEAGQAAMFSAALPVAGKALSAVGPLARRTFGATTGVGDEALAQAFKAGKSGGASAESFTKAMRGESNMDDVLTAAKQNLSDMVQQKQAAYRQGMVDIKSDKSILDFGGIDSALGKSFGMVSFKGQAKNPKAAQALQEVADEINTWKQLDPAEFHTPEGLDALKQKVGSILESLPFEQKTARQAVGDVYNSIKTEINKQAPKYSAVMRDYSDASDLIKEVERSLSLGQKASADTSMRKLQSLMRNNVNTSYGYRDQLARQLESAGGRSIMPGLAGQALSEWTPRGLQRAGAAVTGGGLAMTGNIPAAAGLAAISSPRLAGETAYLLGKGSRMVPESLLDRLRLDAYRVAPVIGAQ